MIKKDAYIVTINPSSLIPKYSRTPWSACCRTTVLHPLATFSPAFRPYSLATSSSWSPRGSHCISASLALYSFSGGLLQDQGLNPFCMMTHKRAPSGHPILHSRFPPPMSHSYRVILTSTSNLPWPHWPAINLGLFAEVPPQHCPLFKWHAHQDLSLIVV